MSPDTRYESIHDINFDELVVDEEAWEARRQIFNEAEREKQRLYQAVERLERRKQRSPVQRLVQRLFG